MAYLLSADFRAQQASNRLVYAPKYSNSPRKFIRHINLLRVLQKCMPDIWKRVLACTGWFWLFMPWGTSRRLTKRLSSFTRLMWSMVCSGHVPVVNFHNRRCWKYTFLSFLLPTDTTRYPLLCRALHSFPLRYSEPVIGLYENCASISSFIGLTPSKSIDRGRGL